MRIAEAAGNKGNDGDAKNQTVEVGSDVIVT